MNLFDTVDNEGNLGEFSASLSSDLWHKSVIKTNVASSAVLSDCGKYRYRLTREWDDTLDRVLWIMLNPSKADADIDDPTIKRCMGYARSWGYGGIEVVNLFGYRATDPADMKKACDPVGRENPSHIRQAATDEKNGIIVCAWGADGAYLSVGSVIAWNLSAPKPFGKGLKLHCLKMTKDGQPCHPLRLPGNLVPVEFTLPKPAAKDLGDPADLKPERIEHEESL